MTSRLVVNSVRHTGASADALTLSSDGKVTFPNNTGNILQVVQTVKNLLPSDREKLIRA